MSLENVDDFDQDDSSDSNDRHAGDRQFTPPADGSWIPRDRLNTEIDKRRAVENELQKAREASQKPQLTRAQLEVGVESGEITEAERDAYLEEQIEARVTDRITSQLASKETEQRVQAQLDDYATAVPDIAKEGSDLQSRIAAEYRDLVSYGYDNDDPKTALAAVKAVLGPLSALKATKAKPKEPDLHEDFGGGGDGGGGDTGKEVKWNDLDGRQKAFYAKAIDRGAYPDRKAVLKELTGYGNR